MKCLIDVFRLSEGRRTESGDFEVSGLPRLGSHVGAFTGGSLHWEATGTEGRRGMPGARLRVTGAVRGTCSRCGDPLEIPVDIDTSFLFARTEAQADAIPLSEDEDDEIVVGSSRFDVAAWVEEEVLLALPLYPVHSGCAAPANPAGGKEEAAERENPFAVLASLRKN